MNGKSKLFTTILICTLAFTAGCADSGEPSARASENSPPAGNTPLTETPTETPSETPTESTETPPETPSEPTDSPSGVLASEAANRPLTLSNVFKYPPGWKEGRYDVADRKQISGISGIVSACGDSYAKTLELRLANNFSKLKLEFGQSNSSQSSDQILQVRIDANGEYIDQKSAKLNQITTMEASVAKVNALKIIVTLKETDGCGTGAVEAVLSNVVLS
jgi:hypothetical protein